MTVYEECMQVAVLFAPKLSWLALSRDLIKMNIEEVQKLHDKNKSNPSIRHSIE